MNYSFEYIDIILLAMIAGFIFLRLRGILGRRTGHKESVDSSFPHDFLAEKKLKNKSDQIIFDEKAKEAFLKGAKIAYETVITNFASGNLKSIKYLLDKKVFDQFNEALKERENKGYKSETTFIGIDSASIKEHNKINNILEVTVDFVSEIISCVKDKDSKILSGDPEKVKKVFDDFSLNSETELKKDPQTLVNYYSEKDNWNKIFTGEEGGNLKYKIQACIACHGPNGQGNLPAGIPVLSGQHALYIEQQLKNFRSGARSNDPNKMMRNVAHRMTDDEIRSVAEYIQGLY